VGCCVSGNSLSPLRPIVPVACVVSHCNDALLMQLVVSHCNDALLIQLVVSRNSEVLLIQLVVSRNNDVLLLQLVISRSNKNPSCGRLLPVTDTLLQEQRMSLATFSAWVGLR